MNKDKILKSLTLVFLVTLGFLFIYTGDDWAWGSSIGINRLSNFFQNYNSRYLSNLLVLLLTRFNNIKALIIGSVLFIIVVLLSKINPQRKDVYLLSLGLILLTPKLIYREAISWTSGFCNYTISTCLTLIYLYYIKDILKKELCDKMNIKTILLFILGLSSNLFIEHNTIYNLVISLFILFFYHYKYKEYNKNLISYGLGSIIGFLIMFLNLSSSTSGNREVASSTINIIINICNNYFGIIYEELVYHNVIINILIFIFVVLLIRKRKLSKLDKISLGISLSYIIYSVFNIIYPSWNIFLDYTPHFEGIFTFFFSISISYLLIKFIKDKIIKSKIIFYIASIVLITLPLLFVSPIGSRCFFITYIFFSLIIIELYNYLVKEKEMINLILGIIVIISSIHLLSINLVTYIENINRLDNIEKQLKESDTVTIERFTYEDYIHGEGTPSPNTLWEDRYKLFYNINSEINIKIKDS